MRLIELGLRHHIIAAACARGVDLKFGGAHLGARDVEGLLRVVERLTRGVAVPRKCRGAVECLLRIQEIRLRLCQRFARRRQCQFIELPHPRFRLGDRSLRLHHGRLQLARFQRDQRLALADLLAFLHQHLVDGAGDLASDLGPERRLDMAAGDDRLQQIAARNLIDYDRWPPYQPHALPGADTESQRNGEDEPFVNPDRGPDG